jgi:uncharacterized protein
MWAAEWMLATALAIAAVAVGATVAARSGETTAAWIIGGVGGIAVLGLAAVGAASVKTGYQHFRYEVTEYGLYVARGWLWQQSQIVPHSRIQTVDTRAGPLHRLFGLVAVEVTTASAAGGTAIPGLSLPVAAALVDELARRAELDEGT